MYSGREDAATLARYQWIVPRRVMCGLFWAGVALIFVGMVLLVTSQHKGKTFQSWGAVVLGLGLCILLSCVILCMHTYFVMSRRNREAQDGNAGNNKAHVNLMNASLTTTMIHGIPADTITDDRTNRLARPPRYGISVVTTPPPTVRLYVSDIVDREQQQSPNDVDIVPETIVIEHQSSSDRKTTSGDGNNPTAPRGGSDASNEDGETWRRRSSTTQPEKRRSADASGNLITQAHGFSDSNVVVAADAWLQHQQATSRTVPLPFPPAHITFDAFESDEVVPKQVTSGLSSCDESFNQSTETIVARGDSSDKRKSSTADSNTRRKSVYYNAVAHEASSNSESDTAVNHSSPVTLPRRTGSKRRRTEPIAANVSATVKVNSKSKSERRISGGGLSTKVKEKPVRGRNDKPSPLVQTPAANDVHRGLTGTTTATTPSSAAEHHPAKCRVTRIHVHSEHASEIPSAASVSVASAAAVAGMSPLSTATYSRATFGDYVSLPVSTATLPSSVRGPQSRTGRGGEVRFSVGDHPATTTQDRRTDGVVPTTARTCGPACVTVTPLRSHVVPVEQCSRFPPPPPATTSRAGRQHRQFVNVEDGDQNDAMKGLDAVDLLRSEYEASFGGHVNPLLLYSGGLADEDVNLSKRTVYDNIQYFKV